MMALVEDDVTGEVGRGGEVLRKRDAPYMESREELKQKYEFGRMDGVA